MPRAISGGTPRCASRAPFSAAAPRITGSAIWREITFASARRKRSSARGGQRRSVARHAGREREGLRESDRERVERAAPGRGSRSSGAPSASAIAADPASSATATGTGSPRRRSIGRSNRYAASAAGRERQRQADRVVAARTSARTRAPRCRRPISSASAPPACSATSNDLRSSGSSSRYRQPQQRRHQHEVAGAGDRQQLGRAPGPRRAPPPRRAADCVTYGVVSVTGVAAGSPRARPGRAAGASSR